jgi:hypothetical protein
MVGSNNTLYRPVIFRSFVMQYKPPCASNTASISSSAAGISLLNS